MILHCMKKDDWDKLKNEKILNLASHQGYIHCSPVEYLWRVVYRFEKVNTEFVFLCIDEEKLNAEVRYEEWENSGRLYPHIYGEFNVDAIVKVLPFLRDKQGHWLKNPEFRTIDDK